MAEVPGEINWSRLENFLGYGNPSAPVVFFGLEEGLADESGLESDLKWRSTFPSEIMDIREAHEQIRGAQRHFSEGAVIQRTWRPMCHLMVRRRNQAPADRESRRDYQRRELGKKAHDGETLLIELFPFPKKGLKHWPEIYASRFGDQQAFKDRLLRETDRAEKLRACIFGHRREIIICYGKEKLWTPFKEILRIAKWDDHGNYLSSSIDGQRIYCVEHFCSRAFNSDARLEELAKTVLRI